MKLTAILFLLTGLSVFAGKTYSQTKKLNLEMPNSTVKEVLQSIEEQSEFYFMYSEKLVDVKREVSIKFKNRKINDVLDGLFAGTDVQYKIRDRFILLTTPEVTGSNLLALEQGMTVTGTVTDPEGNPLPGVNIVEVGTTNGAVTDLDGNYTITVSSEDAVLSFSFIGYLTEQIEVGGQTRIDVMLVEDIQALDEVVVVGYGTQRKVNVTGAVGTVEGEKLVQQPVMQTSQALAGTVPGVTVITESGQPGYDNATIRIRGIGTLGDSNPLVLIDGVPGNLDGVHPRDIQEISVLKDAAASSIYGSRAANGVILVTTKRGNQGKFKLQYAGYVGWQQPTNLPEFVDGEGYMVYYNQAFINQGEDPAFSQEEIADWKANYKTDPDHYPNTDWVNETFSENGFQQNHFINMSGGNDMALFNGSIAYTNQMGNIPNFSHDRYQARLNTDLKISEKFSFNFDINLRRTNNVMPSAGIFNIINQAFRIPPIYVARYSDGSWGPGWSGVQNSVAKANAAGTQDVQENYARAIFKAIYKPVKSLTFTVNYSPEYRESSSKTFNKSYNIYDFDTKELEFKNPPINSLSQNSYRNFFNNFTTLANFEKSYNQHNINVLAGYEINTFRNDFFSSSRDNFLLQDFEQLGAGSRDNMQNNGGAYEWALQSYFGRVNYNYDEKYLLEANLRYDGSSRFAAGNKYGIFPSFSVGWRISQEEFMSQVALFDMLKLRASWGKLGNQNIGNYPFASTIQLGRDFIFGGSAASGAAQGDMANEEISWESTESSNFGLDAGFLNNRLSTTFDYFIRETSDILLRLPVPGIIGLKAPYQNAGVVKNSGWELNLGWRDKINDFQYSVSFNISDVKNEVVDLKGAGPFIGGYTIIKEGYPINSMYGYKNTGFFASQEEIDRAPTHLGSVAPGDLRYENTLTIDTDGDEIDDKADDVINASDRQIIGNTFPRYTYGLNLNFNYKNFDLSIFGQGEAKRDVYLDREASWAFYEAAKIQKWQTDYWTEENQDASYPRLTSGSSGNNYQVSDFWVWSGSYIRLRNLSVGYTIEGDNKKNKLFEHMRLYFTGSNLFTIDSMPPGFDPNVPSGRGSFYPITKTYNFGVDVTF